MEKEGLYQGFAFWGFLFIAFATLLYLCLLGYCDKDHMTFNVLLSLVAEISIFVYMVFYVKDGLKALEKTMSPKGIVKFCGELQVLSFFAIGYSIIQLFFPDVDFYLSLIYGANIFFVAFFFLVWFTLKISKIEKR